ncbi:MAG: mannose-phosphate guanylyltransferase / phosphomannomutase [Gaiellaceae bacterium]|jgi:mannose-1-phosphate guanylyltransferase/phosphomannomutase|nr:mannose-phosphate guanylyltransferase / phosphomannomutase [Gaiellaceae bacterium]
MKAVVMAGGEGTRLRPLTSNQPKPMVPIVGKPCMEHIVELLKLHGFEDIIVTVAFLPQAIRSYFGDGETLGVNIGYSVEESPLGTAGSVRLAAGRLDDTFLVISGDALCDLDLTSLVEFHREKKASVTIGLKAVENPLEFGIVVTDEEGRVERFLEKPSWGQVFSDTINTGIYVLEPEVMQHVPTDRPYDFAKELFPLLLEMGRPIYGHVLTGYWQDIGNLDQFRQANIDALEERVRLNIPGIRIRGNVWVGDGVDLDDLDAIEGPAYLGSYCRISRGARVGPHAVLASSVTVRERGRVVRSMVDSSTYIGRSSEVEGAIIGRGCDIRAHVRIHEGVAIGDEVTIGGESVILPGVRIYPFKEVETGSQLHESLIWESRGTTRLFGKQGVSGMVNVDLTPDVAVRLAAALGSALDRGARVVASREGPAVCRMIKRAMISGLSSTGVHVADLRVSPAAVARHLVKSENYDAGFHVGVSPTDPEIVRIQFFEPPGVEMSPAMRKEVEKHFTRGELRRVAASEVGGATYPARVHETYASELLSTVDVELVRRRGFRIVVDYGFSGASYVLPLVLGPLGVEVVAAHAFAGEATENADAPPGLAAAIGQTKRLVPAVGADLGAVFDRAAERLYLVDEQAREVPVEQALLLFLRLIGSNGRRGKLAFPVTVTSQVDRLVNGSKLEIVRTPASLPELTRAAAQDGVVFAGAVGGGYVFPEFLPGYDAVASLTKLLELLAPVDRPLSALVGELPESTLVHHQIPCPWALKGLVMRVLNERLAGRELDLTDGIKLFEERGWSQALPDPDEPLIHLYAEGETVDVSEELARELRTLVEEIEHGEAAVEPA